MYFWNTPCFFYNLSTELRRCLVQISYLIVSAHPVQTGVYTSVSPVVHLVTELVDRVKYGLGPENNAYPRRVSSLSDEAQLVRCLKRLAGGCRRTQASNDNEQEIIQNIVDETSVCSATQTATKCSAVK